MSQESLSALLDGECTEAQLDALLEELDRDPQLKAAWGRQCLAREAMRGQRLQRKPVDICAGVMAALDAAPPAASDKVVVLAPRRARRLPAWQSVAGLAVAATVAAVAVTLGINFGRVENGNGNAGLSASAADVRPVQYLQTADADEDLRSYLIEHSNTLADRGVGGALSYARFAAHTGEAYAQPASLTLSGPQP